MIFGLQLPQNKCQNVIQLISPRNLSKQSESILNVRSSKTTIANQSLQHLLPLIDKKRKGRPHQGDVKDRETLEKHVSEKRSIFRDLKKIIQNNQNKFKSGLREQINSETVCVPSDIHEELIIRLEQFQRCTSYYQTYQQEKSYNNYPKMFDAKTSNLPYYPIIGDVCYRYNRKSKEIFFADKACSYIFSQATTILEKNIRTKINQGKIGKEKLRIYLDIIQELNSLALQRLRQNKSL
eukprot:403368393